MLKLGKAIMINILYYQSILLLLIFTVFPGGSLLLLKQEMLTVHPRTQMARAHSGFTASSSVHGLPGHQLFSLLLITPLCCLLLIFSFYVSAIKSYPLIVLLLVHEKGQDRRLNQLAQNKTDLQAFTMLPVFLLHLPLSRPTSPNQRDSHLTT